MALIVYPLDDFDSFGTLVELDDFISKNIVSPGWQALDDPTKEVYCRQACQMIVSCNNITLPDDTTADLIAGQAITAVYCLDTSVTGYDANGRAVSAERVDTIAISYDTDKKGDPVTIPPYAQGYLKQYGCSKSTGGFSQTYAGRS